MFEQEGRGRLLCPLRCTGDEVSRLTDGITVYTFNRSVACQLSV
jgi:hypothetical protein